MSQTPPPIRERLSPDGRFKLVIAPVESRPGAWNTLDIQVRRTQGDVLIGKTTRNYPVDSILHFVQQDGQDYLVLSENYHGGYGLMDLATGEKVVFDPREHSPAKGEQFWCWAAPVSHDAEARQLVISGCYWACPYDRITFDFSHPMSPPYAILNTEDEPWEDEGEDDEEAEAES